MAHAAPRTTVESGQSEPVSEPGVSKHQRGNLKKLASYLEALPRAYRHFNMSYFQHTPGATGDKVEALKLDCGAVGCAVGHGPDAGIKPKRGEDWADYAGRAFGTDCNDGLWDWCFNACWMPTDNTPQGAAKRIRWFLERGIPVSAEEQMLGEAPLCYVAATGQ